MAQRRAGEAVALPGHRSERHRAEGVAGERGRARGREGSLKKSA